MVKLKHKIQTSYPGLCVCQHTIDTNNTWQIGQVLFWVSTPPPPSPTPGEQKPGRAGHWTAHVDLIGRNQVQPLTDYLNLTELQNEYKLTESKTNHSLISTCTCKAIYWPEYPVLAIYPYQYQTTMTCINHMKLITVNRFDMKILNLASK